MNKNILRNLIRDVASKKVKTTGTTKYIDIKILETHPELIPILSDLMTPDFHLFTKDIEWIAPTPKTYRVVLKNNEFFYLYDLGRSWVAQVAGKKHYLLSLGEETMASKAISKLLRYTPALEGEVGEEDIEMDSEVEDTTELPVEDVPTGDELPTELTPA